MQPARCAPTGAGRSESVRPRVRRSSLSSLWNSSWYRGRCAAGAPPAVGQGGDQRAPGHPAETRGRCRVDVRESARDKAVRLLLRQGWSIWKRSGMSVNAVTRACTVRRLSDSSGRRRYAVSSSQPYIRAEGDPRIALRLPPAHAGKRIYDAPKPLKAAGIDNLAALDEVAAHHAGGPQPGASRQLQELS